MNILCERENCKHRRINNSFKNLNICGKETAKRGTTGRCKSFEKKYENFQAVCDHSVVDRKWSYKHGAFIKFCTKCRKVIEVIK